MAVTLTAGQSATVGIDAWASITLVVNGSASLEFTSDAPVSHPSFSVTQAQSRTYGPFGAPMSVVITAIDRSMTYLVNGGVGGYSYDASTGAVTGLVGPDGEEYALTQTYTWAALPAASAYIGTAHVSDIGAHGSLWRSDGSTWGIVGGRVVLASYGADLTVTAASTSEVDLVTLDIPAGLMGLNGQIVVTHFWEATNNANVKTMRVKLGGTAFFANATAINSNAIFLPPPTIIWNRNSQSSQMAFAGANGNVTVATGTAKTTGTVDTSAATTLVISGQKATGSDTLTLMGYRVELVRP